MELYPDRPNHVLPEEAGKYNPDFVWRSREGNLLVKDMKAKHIFYVWLMIWNHAAPKHMQVWFTHKYVFSYPKYTPEYMLVAFKAMYSALLARWDELGPKMKQAVGMIEGMYSVRQAQKVDWLLEEDYDYDDDDYEDEVWLYRGHDDDNW